MYVECLETLAEFLSPSYLPLYEKALKRMQRYGYILERFISPEGYFPYIILSSDGTQECKCRPQLWNPLYTREEVINHYRKAVTHYEYLLPFYDYLLILKPQNYVQSWMLKMKYVWKVLMIRIELVFRLILSPLVPAPNRKT